MSTISTQSSGPDTPERQQRRAYASNKASAEEMFVTIVPEGKRRLPSHLGFVYFNELYYVMAENGNLYFDKANDHVRDVSALDERGYNRIASMVVRELMKAQRIEGGVDIADCLISVTEDDVNLLFG